MTLTREQFDYIWKYSDETQPDEVTYYCNASLQEMEPDFADSMTYDQLSEYYLTPEVNDERRL